MTIETYESFTKRSGKKSIKDMMQLDFRRTDINRDFSRKPRKIMKKFAEEKESSHVIYRAAVKYGGAGVTHFFVVFYK